MKMAYILYGMVTLFVISCNSVFTHDTIVPEGTETCAFQCGRDIQQMFHSIAQLKNNLSSFELKEEERQNKISALETNWTLSNSKIRDLTEQNKNLIQLETNCTIISEKHLQQQQEIDDFKDNMSSLQSENLVMKNRINNLECLLHKSTGISNCADLYQIGERENRVYTFDLCGKSYQLYCDMTQDGGGWTVIQRRFDGSVYFFRNWDSYKTGFGNLTTEFWLGNDLTSLLTKYKKFDLHIDLEDFEGEHKYAEYSDFQLGDEDEKFTLHIGSYSGDAGDALTYHNGQKFSTYDSDNDKSSGNCAVSYKGAFWFAPGCHDAHLNGQYSATSSAAGHAQGLVWLQWKGHNYSLKKSTMKIRPIHF